jgi:hypothetical protein
VIDILGRYDLGDQPQGQQFPDDITISRPVGSVDYTVIVAPSNVPNYSSDNIIDAAFGFKMNLKESLLIMGNIFVPLNDAGLRADVIPTLGLEFSF